MIWHDWIDPLQGNPYNFWSGIGSGSPVLGALGVWWHHEKCVSCWRKGHKDPRHGHPVCRKHQPKL